MDLDYRKIFKEFNDLGIDYLVVGGMAVNFHGVPRMTYDIDLMVLLQSENILNVISKLTTWGYRPRLPVDPRDLADASKRYVWIEDKGMKALNFFSEALPIGEIDLVIDSPIPYNELKKRAVEFDLEGIKMPTISLPDLIELKIRAGRKQDVADAEHLKMILEK